MRVKLPQLHSPHHRRVGQRTQASPRRCGWARCRACGTGGSSTT